MKNIRLARNSISVVVIVVLILLVLPAGASAAGWTWSVKNSGATDRMNCVHATGPGDVWVGGEKGTVYHYDGGGWKSSNIGVSDLSVLGIYALDGSHVWASVGGGGYENCTVYFFNGRNWAKQPRKQNMYNLGCVTASSPTEVWAGGGAHVHNSVVWKLDKGTWQADMNWPGAGEFVHTIQCIGNNVWAGTSDGSIYHKKEKSTTWNRILQGGPAITGLTVLGPDDIWAAGSMYNESTETWSGGVLHYDGSKWQRWDGLYHDVFAVSGSDVWASAGQDIMHYDGSRWSLATTTDNMRSCNFWADSSHLFAIPYGLLTGNYLYGEGEPPPPFTPTSRTWAHDSIGAPNTAKSWYLAEGCTGGDFETYVLVQNPGPLAADVDLTFMTPMGVKAGPSESLPPKSRKTYNVAQYAPGEWEVSTRITSNRDIIAERAMYGNGRAWAHDSIGTSTPAKNWYLAEGCTGGDFETYVLVQNPNNKAVGVNLTFMTPAGAKAGPTETLPGNSRKTYNVARYAPGEWEVSTTVEADGDVIAERAMYGNGRAWAHDSIGTSTPAKNWYLAEGCTGGDFETYVLVQNPNNKAVGVNLTFMTPAGAKAGPTETLPGNSRKTYNVAQYAPGEWEVSTKVTGSSSVIAERAMYGNGRAWAHDSIGAAVLAETWYLAEGSTGAGFETWVLVANPGGSPASVTVTYMTPGGERPGPVVSLDPGTRKSFNVYDGVPGAWEVSTKISSNRPVVAERAMYGDRK